MNPQVAIIDSGGANIASLTFAFGRLGVESRLTEEPSVIRSSTHVVLPGVGAAAPAMQRLRERRLTNLIRTLAQPVLGICLGMHLLADRSEEDDAGCLGVIPAVARKLHAAPGAPVPNMGWCRVRQNESHPLFDGIPDDSYFYFVHSYALPAGDYSLATAMHASPMTAVAACGNFVATQFHPERSSAAGARLLGNF
ncbi:MAG: imidazole glycerol phosphate synthase subunit HisH, partial [Planctomycetaceae bacterium]